MEQGKPIPGDLEIALTGAELEEMGIRLEELDSDSAKLRQWLLRLVETACTSGRFVLGESLYVEIRPTEEGGCTVRLSAPNTPPRWRVLHRTQSPVVYAFEDVEDLISGSVKLFSRCSHRICKSALYQVGAGWRLLICPLDALESPVLRLLDEYAPRCGEGALAAAWLEEHGRLAVSENAVDLLFAYFG